MTYAKYNALRHAHCQDGSESPTYRSWKAMKRRCKSKNVKYAPYFDVSFDPSWEDFSAFLSEMGERPNDTSLDRIDNSMGYSKDNCRWSDRNTQNRNRSSVKLTESDIPLIRKKIAKGVGSKEIAEKFKCSYQLINDIRAGRAWRNVG